MFDMAWEEEIAEVHAYIKNKEETLIKAWLGSIGFKEPIGYYRNISKNTLEIYTTRPGVLIGRGGVNVDVLRQMLTKEFRGEWQVKFVEIRGGFVQV